MQRVPAANRMCAAARERCYEGQVWAHVDLWALKSYPQHQDTMLSSHILYLIAIKTCMFAFTYT